MKTIFLAGPFTDLENFSLEEYYSSLEGVILSRGYKSFSFFKVSLPPNSDVYEASMEKLSKSSASIFYVGKPSLAVGVELYAAQYLRLPSLCLFHEDDFLSTFISHFLARMGSPAQSFRTSKDLNDIVDRFLDICESLSPDIFC